MIREYRERDRPFLELMHLEMGMDYVFPNIDHPEFFSRLVSVDDDDIPTMAILGRLSAEMYLLFDKELGSSKSRLGNFLELHLSSEQDMRLKGVEDCFAEIPPGKSMEKFKRLLEALGWQPADTWENWTKAQLSKTPTLPNRLLRSVRNDYRLKE